ncbi:MAG: hypothetical protein H6955_06385 [Chromatiaceae bacterium]|nr:hypothetical protein [Chromatiaceae bacterium]
MPKLREVHWFSCLDDVDTLQSLTLWQAIVYILRHTKGLPDEAYWPYIEELHELEVASAGDIVADSNNRNIDPSVQFDLADGNGIEHFKVSDASGAPMPPLEDLAVPTPELDEFLELLELNRKNLTEQFAIPSVLFTILSAELARATMGLPIALQLKNKTLSYRWPLIRRTSLNEWQRANALTALHLQQAGEAMRAKRKTVDHTERLYLLIGIIGRLITQADDGFRKQVARGKFSVDALVKLVRDRAADDHIQCPGIRTLTTYFNDGERACIDQTLEDHAK